jgi:hypothetical protein
MTLYHLRQDDVDGAAREARFPLAGALKRIGAGFRWLHRAIVSAKLRRLQRELMFRHDYDELLPPEQDVSKVPQRPLILGDKWDF